MSQISDLRCSTGLSQTQFASYFHIPVGTLQDWEQGRRKPAEYIISMMQRILSTDEKLPVKYISGEFALNLQCNLETCGDWHTSGMNWNNCIKRMATTEYPFFHYGIEFGKYIPSLKIYANQANHIRACLDLLKDGNFAVAQGMKNDYICNDKYDNIVMEKVMLLRDADNWDQIDQFMTREYKNKWVSFIRKEEYDFSRIGTFIAV